MPATREIQAAGAVVFRPGPEVLLVHRPKYDDWSFPKGKLDPGEPTVAAAVREVEEETGLRVRLGRPLPAQRYEVRGVPKRVRYWTARTVADDDVSGYVPNHEIDEVVWVPVAEAYVRLSYRFDRQTLRSALEVRKRTLPLVVLRHGEARSRTTWHGDDRDRPLVVAGRKQAVAAAGILGAYDVRRVITSPSERCLASVTPYAAERGLEVEQVASLTEEDATVPAVAALARDALARLPETGGTVVCSHRPVLPWLFESLGVRDPRLEKGEMLVLHVRKDRVVATERHLAR